MGKRVIEILFDDVTGEEAEEVVEHEIAVDGKKRYIDMAPATFERFMEAVGPFFEKGRRGAMGGSKPASRGQVPRHDPDERDRLRAWCVRNGVKFSRGRAPASVWDAFYADDPDQLPPEKRTKRAASSVA